MVSVDGVSLNFDFTIDDNIWAVQWNGTSGIVEFKDSTPNEEISSIAEYQSVIDEYDTEKARIPTPVVVSVHELKSIRNELLMGSDFRALSDYPGTDQADWLAYRQLLRDLPVGYVEVVSPSYPSIPGS
jgi:hypothetical protein